MPRYLIGTVLLTLTLLSACAMARHREQVRNGMLTTGLAGEAFLEEWGPPTRTSTMTGDEVTRAEWMGMSGGYSGSFSGSFTKGKQGYDVWDYAGEVILVFVSSRGHLRLVTWKTEKTVSQLREWSAKRAGSR
jgi:hypothetical protein